MKSATTLIGLLTIAATVLALNDQDIDDQYILELETRDFPARNDLWVRDAEAEPEPEPEAALGMNTMQKWSNRAGTFAGGVNQAASAFKGGNRGYGYGGQGMSSPVGGGDYAYGAYRRRDIESEWDDLLYARWVENEVDDMN